MYNPPFKSSIFYSVQNEDYQTELAILRRLDNNSPLRVLLVASSGENALSLLTQDIVAEIHAVDINPAQLHLCELRRTAAEHLTQAEQLRFLGADPATSGPTGESERLELFERIHPYLPEAAHTFWETCRDREIAFGVHHVGRNDVLMHDLQERLQSVGFDPLGRPLKDEDLPRWKNVYTGLMTPDYIREVFGLPSEALAAKIAEIAGYLGECHFRALQQPHPQRDPFLTTAFANSYATTAGEAGFPLYLQPQGQAALQQLGTRERLHLHTGNVLEQMTLLANSYGPFDLISISNIADWMNEAQFSATVVQARDCLKPGGALLARTATGRPMIIEVMRQQMSVDDEFNTELPQIERGPWFRTISTGFRQ
jgi:S-adenosylmethionine:diacylglycerol 3-amino-3-carboxypropyl transferase